MMDNLAVYLTTQGISCSHFMFLDKNSERNSVLKNWHRIIRLKIQRETNIFGQSPNIITT